MRPLPPSWYQAIFIRHSRRSFMSQPPEVAGSWLKNKPLKSNRFRL